MAITLIDSNLEDPTKVDPLAAQATASGYDAVTSEVSQPTDTVSGQLNTLLSSGSPYLERARYGAAETANARGLLNSSMAAGAGEAAAIDAALPIASQDAGIYNTTRLTNQQYRNRASEFGANAANTVSMFNTGQSNQFASQRLGAGLQKEIIGAQTAAEKELIGERTTAQKSLAEQAYGFRLGELGFMEGINTRMATLQNTFATDMAKLNADLQANTIIPAEYAQRKALLEKQQQYNLESMQRQSEIAEQFEQLKADLQTGQIMPTEYGYKKDLLDAQLENALKLQDAQLKMAETLQTMKGEQAEKVAAIEGTFKSLMQTSASATNLFHEVTGLMAKISADPNISDEGDPSPRDIALDNMIGMLELGLTVVGEIGDVGLADLIDWGGEEVQP